MSVEFPTAEKYLVLEELEFLERKQLACCLRLASVGPFGSERAVLYVLGPIVCMS